jgi:hypothetical protein
MPTTLLWRLFEIADCIYDVAVKMALVDIFYLVLFNEYIFIINKVFATRGCLIARLSLEIYHLEGSRKPGETGILCNI